MKAASALGCVCLIIGSTFTASEQVTNTCTNGVKDDNEADVDCGQDCFQLCRTGQHCISDFDCDSGSCLTTRNWFSTKLSSSCGSLQQYRFLLGSSGSSGASGPANATVQNTTSMDNNATTSKCPPIPAAQTPPVCPPCDPKIIDLTKSSDSMIQPGYETSFGTVVGLSCMGSFLVGMLVGIAVLNSYNEREGLVKVHPDGKGGGLLPALRRISVDHHKGARMVFHGDDRPVETEDLVDDIEKNNQLGMQKMQQESENKKVEMNRKVQDRLASRRNKLAMKLAKSKALEKVDCFAGLKADHMSMVIGKMKLISYDEGDIICSQGDIGTDFYVIMGGTLNCKVHDQFVRTMGELEWFGERALVGKNPKRSATITASSKAECFVLSNSSFQNLEKDGVHVKEIIQRLQPKIKEYEKNDEAMYDVKMNGLRAAQAERRASKQGINRQGSSASFIAEMGANAGTIERQDSNVGQRRPTVSAIDMFGQGGGGVDDEMIEDLDDMIMLDDDETSGAVAV